MGVIDALSGQHVYLDTNVFVYAVEGGAPDLRVLLCSEMVAH
jgi:hypothetical protein